MHCWSLMLFALCAITTLPCSTFAGNQFSARDLFSLGGRVIGGDDAELGQFPYHLQLRLDGNYRCGATLVENAGKQIAITAAHCVTSFPSTDPFDPSQLRLTAGIIGIDDEGQTRAVKINKVHEGYSFSDVGAPLNDIAILHFDEDFQIDNKLVKSLALPGKDQATTGEVTLSGWGRYSVDSNDLASKLQFAILPVVDSQECNDWYGEEIGASEVITDSMLCAGYENAEKSGCNGDSGGPVAGKEGDQLYLAGVASWTYKGCSKYSTVFTRVSSFIDWINSNSS